MCCGDPASRLEKARAAGGVAGGLGRARTGGHRQLMRRHHRARLERGDRMHGDRSLWPLLAEVSTQPPITRSRCWLPVASQRPGLVAAALAAGADGVRMGTRFLATAEPARTRKQALIAPSPPTRHLRCNAARPPQDQPDLSRHSKLHSRFMATSSRRSTSAARPGHCRGFDSVMAPNSETCSRELPAGGARRNGGSGHGAV